MMKMRNFPFPAALATMTAICVLGACGSASDTADVDTLAVPADGVAKADGVNETAAGDAVTPDGNPDPASDLAVPELVPFEPSLVESLQAALEDYVYFSGDPGVGFAIHDGPSARWSSVAGMADKVNQVPMSDGYRFRVGSNTKPMIATVVLMLWEEGLVELDAPLTDYLPQYPQWGQVTIRQLLGMSAGIPEFLNSDEAWLQILAEPDKVYSPEEVVGFVEEWDLDYPPGEGCAYSNTNFTLLGMVIEAVTGEKAAALLANRLFEPLDMTSTFLETGSGSTEALVNGYIDMAVLAILLDLPDLLLALIPPELFLDDTMVIDATTLLPPSFTWTAGAVVSTPDDMAVFMRALQTGQLIGPDALAEMRDFKPCALLGGFVDYGLGLMRYDKPFGTVYGHGGLNFGFHVETFYLPDEDVAYCHMHNFLPAQTVAVADGVLIQALAGGGSGLKPCTAPDDFFADNPVSEPYLKLLFKGPIANAGGDEKDQRPGMANIWATLGDKWTRYFGFDRVGIYASATLQDQGLGPRVIVNAFGPGSKPGTMGNLSLNMAASAVDNYPAKGNLNLGPLDRYTVAPTLVDLYFETPGDLMPNEYCVTAVPDYSRPSRLFLCDPETTAEPGNMLRMGAYLALAVDPETIDGYLTLLGIARCGCLNAQGRTVECEQ